MWVFARPFGWSLHFGLGGKMKDIFIKIGLFGCEDVWHRKMSHVNGHTMKHEEGREGKSRSREALTRNISFSVLMKKFQV